MRLVDRFGLEEDKAIKVYSCFMKKDGEVVLEKESKNFKSLSAKYPSVTWFERKIRDDFGVEFEGSFDIITTILISP